MELMNAVVISEPRRAAAQRIPIPTPQKGEALLKMLVGGVCGSDLASYRGQSAYVSYPRVIGHEFAAQVVEAEPNEYGITPGMIVTGNPYFNCGQCYSCRRGYVNACVNNQTMGVQREGAFSEYFTMPLERLYNGQGIPPEALALIEPFCISYHGSAGLKSVQEIRYWWWGPAPSAFWRRWPHAASAQGPTSPTWPRTRWRWL